MSTTEITPTAEMPEATLRPTPYIAELEAKAAKASDRASKLYNLLWPDDDQPDYEIDTESTFVDDWQAELNAMHAEYLEACAEDLEMMKSEYSVQQERMRHFRRLITQAQELASGTVRYPATEFLVDGWLPTKEIHLLIGESGAGKTTWLFSEFLAKWQCEEPILGHASHYVPYAVLVNDRSKEGIVRTLERLRLHPESFPIKSINNDTRPLDKKVEAFCDANPRVRFLIIEGIHCGMTELNDYSEVSKVMASLVKLCRDRNLTIFGTTHVSKAAAANGVNGRTAAIGSVATAGMSETLFVLTRDKTTVTLTVNDHNGPERTQCYKQTDGRLEETDAATAEGFPTGRIAHFLTEQETDTFKRPDYLAFCREIKNAVKTVTADRDLKEAKDRGWIALSTDDKTGKSVEGFFQILKRPKGWEARVMKNG